ncbi:MAG TPA: GFA family protein [Gammaproteobacteria bacterium]|nr:GFA family protein [Gammaproteobacteria bacterium]
MYTGGCLCGTVRFEITGAIRNIVYCHCSQCRKAQGSAFATNGIVDAGGFRLTAGAQNLTAYEAMPGKTRYFCRTCGSPIMSRNDAAPGQVRIRLGTVESDIAERPGAHIFITSKANWETISDELPRYEGYEPQR